MSELSDRLSLQVLGDTPLEFEDPTSSLVERASYEPGQQLLHVTLKAGKVLKTYRYGGVCPTLWMDFYHAHSKGHFFSQQIRPMFVGALEDTQSQR